MVGYREANNLVDQKEWFIKELRYDFSAQIDSIDHFDNSDAYLICHLTKGQIKDGIEDSLNEFVTHYGHLRLLLGKPPEQMRIWTRTSNKYQVGDSVCLRSTEDVIEFFRYGRIIDQTTMNKALDVRGWTPDQYFRKKAKNR